MPQAEFLANESLATASQRVEDKFKRLEASKKSVNDEQLSYNALIDESQRFSLWEKEMGLLGVHNTAHHTLRNAIVTHDLVVQFMEDLEELLQTIEDHWSDTGLDEATSPTKALEPSDEQTSLSRGGDGHQDSPESDESFEDEEEEKKDLESYGHDPLARIALSSIKEIIDKLYRISREIAHPTIGFGLPKAQVQKETWTKTDGNNTQKYASSDEQQGKPSLCEDFQQQETEKDEEKAAKRQLNLHTGDDSVAPTETRNSDDPHLTSPDSSLKVPVRQAPTISQPIIAEKSGKKPQQSPTGLDASMKDSQQPSESVEPPRCGIPPNLSFLVKIEPLSPDYSVSGQSPQRTKEGYFLPPDNRNGYKGGEGPTIFLRWTGGRMSRVERDDPIRAVTLRPYKTATVFSQVAEHPHLLAVPFDARVQNVRGSGRGWSPLTFDHEQISGTNSYYSYISWLGSETGIAATGSSHWMPQLLPDWYQYRPRSQASTRIQAGLIGNLPLLIALAAFSLPPNDLSTLLSSLQPGTWSPHVNKYPSGHVPERGMVVTVYLDPLNPAHSTRKSLDKLQNGQYGPFYGPLRPINSVSSTATAYQTGSWTTCPAGSSTAYATAYPAGPSTGYSAGPLPGYPANPSSHSMASHSTQYTASPSPGYAATLSEQRSSGRGFQSQRRR